jgi:hypothetical protein
MTNSNSEATVLPLAIPTNQSGCTVGVQKLRRQLSELRLAARVLHGPIEDHVIRDQVLPIFTVRIECVVVLLDNVLCLCVHEHTDQCGPRLPSVLPAWRRA